MTKTWRWDCCRARASSTTPPISMPRNRARGQPNVVNVRLRPDVHMETQTATRRFSAGSSCGVCGTTGLDAAIARAAAISHLEYRRNRVAPAACDCPNACAPLSQKFADTGGIHAAALFDFSGNLMTVAEDVGRHNAFDKLVGQTLLAGRLPLKEHIIVLSGRASF